MVQMNGLTRVMLCRQVQSQAEGSLRYLARWQGAHASREAGCSVTACWFGRSRKLSPCCPAQAWASAAVSVAGQAAGSSAYLVVAGPEAPPHVLVIQHLHLEAEVLFHVLCWTAANRNSRGF
jgi:phage tail tape-measure protein